MKFQFESNQQYQLDAIQSVVDVFTGQLKMDGSVVIGGQSALDLEGQQLRLEATSARRNVLSITSDQIIENVHRIQEQQEIAKSEIIEIGGTTFPLSFPVYFDSTSRDFAHGMNFSVEMETGTGKTYVYLRTIHELHENYGWKKFIVVVPSVAIREGVLKNLEVTKEHFAELYNKPEMNYYVWDSKKTGLAREFATNDTLQIMVITIDSLAGDTRIMNKESDYGRPLDFIKATNPVVIMDEPQNMETDIRKMAIERLNPLCTLRYSATHKHPYNMLYRMTPVDAYDKGLVKKIEVHSVLSEDSYNDAYIHVLSLERKNKTSSYAKVEVDKGDERGLQRQVINVAPGDDLAQRTGRSIYEGYYVEAINHAENCLEFSNGKVLYVGKRNESLHEEILKRQIELTIEDHFEKQQKLASENIKVLSLFFIDKVANYREYNENGYTKGKFAKWFEEAFAKVAARPRYAGVLGDLTAEQVHDGYFAADKSGHWKDSKDAKGEGGKTKDDDTTYNKIMREKEKLLDMNEPLQFIFSHSALREGWDNPNVFNICTLNESSSEMKKRQEIGRGLRLPVNADGERVRDEGINVLTVIANQSYIDFSRKLQTEIEDETGIAFGEGRIKKREDRKAVQFRKSAALDPAFKELWEKIKYKTTYRVNIEVDQLIVETVKQLQDVAITRPQVVDTRHTIETMSDGVMKARESFGANRAVRQTNVRVPNLLEAIQTRTYMTRKLIFDVLDQASMFEYVTTNPQQVIDEVSWAINRVKHQLAVDGIKYERTGEEYDMRLFENKELESYLYNAMSTSGAIEVEDAEKTTHDYVVVDSKVEYDFMRSLEQTESVKFYVKLPSWFKIDTPLGSYNPDWAIVFHDDERIYFVAETKDTNDINDPSLRGPELGKIKSAKIHFEEIGVPYAAPIKTLPAALIRIVEDK
jgi:type III restriction enzyme